MRAAWVIFILPFDADAGTKWKPIGRYASKATAWAQVDVLKTLEPAYFDVVWEEA